MNRNLKTENVHAEGPTVKLNGKIAQSDRKNSNNLRGSFVVK